MQKHILKSTDLLPEEILRLFMTASRFEKSAYTGLEKFVVALIFHEPSTRTRLFENAVKRLGGQTVVFDNAARSSAGAKGESLSDTIRVLSGQFDCLVVRHPDKDQVREAVAHSLVPVINAGDGDYEHPTQSYIDAYAVWKSLRPLRMGVKPRIEKKKLHVLFWGDVMSSRTVRSFAKLLAVHGEALGIELERVGFFGPTPFGTPPDDILDAVKKVCPVEVHSEMPTSLAGVDILYATRIQAERHTETALPAPLLPELADTMPSHGLIMSPMPRVGTLPPELDSNPRSCYFEQSDDGLFVRMALMHHMANHGQLKNGK
jgi:aspartate carbamoyltransferase